MVLDKTLDTVLPKAAVLVRANHQAISVYLGTIPTLEAFAISNSMRSVIRMAMYLPIGIGMFVVALTFLEAWKKN